MAATVAGAPSPGVVLFFAWLALVVLALILLAWIAHIPGGSMLDLRLGTSGSRWLCLIGAGRRAR